MFTRSSLLKAHKWLGLAVAILFIVQGLTGASIVFRDEIDTLIHPQLTVKSEGERKPVQSLLDMVRRTKPDYGVSRVEFPERRDGALIFRLTAKKDKAPYQVAVDPYRGAIVRQGGLLSWPTELMFEIHDELAAGEIGHTIVGLEGLALLFMAITGPIVWWPGRKRLKKGFEVTLNGGPDRAFRSLHRSVGAAAAIILVMSATTGAMMVWKEPLRKGFGTFSSVVAKPSPKVAEQSGRALLPVDRLIRSAQQAYGSTDVSELRFSGGHGRVVTVYLRADTSSRPNATKQIWFDGYDGTDLGHYVAGTLPAGNEFLDWLFPVHIGQAFGLPGRLLLLFSGISLAGLSASGIWLWLSSRRQRERRRAKRAMRMAPVPTNASSGGI